MLTINNDIYYNMTVIYTIFNTTLELIHIINNPISSLVDPFTNYLTISGMWVITTCIYRR